MRTFLLVLFLSFTGTSTLFGQLTIQNFAIAQGLPQMQVSCMGEDSLGYLWMGTLGGGLTRFDGQTFKTFTIEDGLPNNFIRDLLVLGPDKIWVATQKGVSFYDGRNFTTYKPSADEGILTIKIFNHLDSVFYLLSNETGGVIVRDSIYPQITNPAFLKITKLLKTQDKTFILHSAGEHPELITLDGNTLVKENVNNKFTTIFSAFTRNNSTVLSTNGGLYTRQNNSLVKFSDVSFPVYGYDPVHDQFIGVQNFNLVTTPGDASISIISPLKSLFLSGLQDKEGITWLGSDKGLFKIYPNNFDNLLTGNERDDPVTAIAMHDNLLWIGTTYQGIKVYKGSELIKKYNFQSAKRNFINFLKKDRTGTFWVGTVGGIAYFDNGNFTWAYPESVPSAVDIDFDASGNWVVSGENKGLYQLLPNGTVKVYAEFVNTLVWAVLYNSAKDYFMLGTNVGLKKLSKGTIEDITIPQLSQVEISVLEWLDPETLLIGTFGKGVFLYSMRSNRVMKVIDESTGLSSNTLFFVRSDSSGIWAGTERGINLIDYNLHSNKVKKITHFGAADGLLGSETNLNAVLKDNERLLFGLVDGLYIYKPGPPDNSGKLHVDDLKLFFNQKPEKPEQLVTNTNYTNTFNFSHEENHLTLSFNKVAKKKPVEIYYTYRLEGHDQIWSTPTQIKRATYSNLKPGQYFFHVAATDKSGTFIYDETVLTFNIIPALYQTAYFKLALFLLAAGLIILFIHYFNRIRIRRALYIQEIKDNEKTKLRKEIARDFHDELGNQVARMINYIGLLRINKNLENDTYETLNEFSQRILTGAKDFVWTLDPTNDELNNTIIHLKDFGERMFSEKGIEFRFHGEIASPVKIPMGFSRQINLIFKEAMTNTFKHSQATAADFNLRINDCEIILTLKDNGIGINPEKLENSQRGLDNIKSRAKRINGKVKFQSSEFGTTLELVLPR